ncbi:MAG TPA: hypothetical protein VKS79_23515 [Gemmataceae bacterium]|nr:hypothetical protein [Gemmataceae bacterium]
MLPPPPNLDGARVLKYAIVDSDVIPTGNTTHRVGNLLMGPAAALAICQYDGDDGFFLFYCDSDWNVDTDGWHGSLQSALEQANFEYRGISFQGL